MQRLRTVFFGTPEFSVPAFRFLAAETDLLAAVVRPDRPTGRGRKLTSPPVKQAAVELGKEILQPEKMKESWFQDRLRELSPELIVTAAFGRIIPPEILDLPVHGCWNLHASLLPKYRGAAPIQRAIWDGEKETGITLMQMDPGMDTGPMLIRRSCPIEDDDNTGILTDRLARLGAEVLGEGLRKLQEGAIEAVPQPEAGTLAPMISAEDTWIDWTMSAEGIRNQVRALAPRPGAHVRTPSGVARILAARVAPGETCSSGSPPGTVVGVTKKSLTLAAGDHTCLSVEEIQPSGKGPMPIQAFLQGREVTPGQRWEGRA